MPFCPVCRDEFEDWVEICPDCRVALVDELPPLPFRKWYIDSVMYYKTALNDPNTHITTISNEPVMRIATAPNEPIAYMWAGVLEENGIHCLLNSSNLKSAMYSLLINQQYTIHVLKSSALRAKRLLSPFEKSHREYVYSKNNVYPVYNRIIIIFLHLMWLLFV